MYRISSISAGISLILPLCMAGSASAEKAKSGHVFALSDKSEVILDHYCFNCHDEDTQKGNIRLDNLEAMDTAKRLDLLNRVQEQIYFQHMPPKEKRQPNEEERKSILGFIFHNSHQPSFLILEF